MSGKRRKALRRAFFKQRGRYPDGAVWETVKRHRTLKLSDGSRHRVPVREPIVVQRDEFRQVKRAYVRGAR